MDTAQRKLAFQVQFWGLIGPVVALVTLLVILIKSPPQAIYLSMATILGLLTSWKWQTKGALVSLGSILLLYLYQFSEITPDEHLWHIGMNMAIVMGFAITALSFQEIEQLLHTPFVQTAEPGSLSEEIQLLKKYVEEKEAQITSFEGLVDTVKTESVKSHLQHEKLIAELLSKQQIVSTTEEMLHAAKEQIKQLTENTVGINHLEASLDLKKMEVITLQNELKMLSLKVNETVTPAGSLDYAEMDELKSTNELLSRERGRLESLLFRNQIDLHQKTQELANLQQEKQGDEAYKLEKQVLELALKEAELREQELENKIYEKAKIIDAFDEKLQHVALLESQLNDMVAEKSLNLAKMEEIEAKLKAEIEEKGALVARFKEQEDALQAEIQEKHKKFETFIKIEEDLEKTLQSKNALQDEYEMLQNTYSENEKAFKAEIHHAIEEKNEKLKKIDELQSQLNETQQKKQALNEELLELKTSYENVVQAFEEIKARQEQLLQEKELQEKLLQEKELQEKLLQEKELQQKELPQESILKESAEQQEPNNLVFDFKKIQGKYNQLREQFELKSQVLNETRKELFRKEESLAKAELELKEIQNYDLSKQEASMQAYILNLIEESNLKNKELQQEIDELQTIIARLLKS